MIGGSAANAEAARMKDEVRMMKEKAKRMTEIRLRTSKCEIGKTGKSKEQQRTENGEMLPGGERLK